MKPSFRMLAVIAVVCVLSVVLRTPYVLASTPVPTTETTDRDTLVALYHATDGDSWTNNDNWLSDAPIDTWYGVTTDENGRVIELDLRENGLSGTIPSELDGLSYLQVLNLAGNELRGTIPLELTRLSYLQWINLASNSLRGVIPLEFANLINLTGLVLSDNELRGSIPPELGNLTNLKWLYLWGNQLSGTIPPELGNLTTLEELYLRSNQLSGTIPPELGNLATLEELYLWGNQLSGTIPPELGKLVSLVKLQFGANKLIGTIPSELGNLANLEELGLFSNQLNGAIPPELGNLVNLKHLVLSDNNLTGTIPPELGNLANLELLFLSENQLSGTIPPQLDNLTNLKWLHLWGNKLTGTIPHELGNLTNLTRIYLSENLLTGCVPELWRNLNDSDLEELSLPFCTDRDVLVALYRATTGAGWTNSDNWLTDMPIGNWHGVTTNLNGRVIELDLSENGLNGTIPPALGSLVYLETLILAHNQLSGSIPRQLGKLTNLEWLSLWDNKLRGTIPQELGKLSNLTWLDLEDNRLTGSIPPHLGNLINLKWLYLTNNQLSGSIPPQLGKLIYLEELFLSGNSLSGCLPAGWKDIEENDFDEPGLPFCTDRDALVALYQAADGASWTNSDNWLTDTPIGTWYGVTTDERGRVIELDLSQNGLRGTIPSELGQLNNLEFLFLFENNLSGTIPPELSNLTYLKVLGLGANELSGTIPSELGNLPYLEVLHLRGNKLIGEIPLELGKLTYLVLLNLSDNELDGEIPPELGKLTNLEWLALFENELSGRIPPELGNLTNLEGLSLWGNQLTTSIPSKLGNLTNLESLFLADNMLLIGCVPRVWRDIEESDLEDIGLPFCTDTDALVAVYEATDGANWSKNDNWLTDAPIGTWYGVTMDGSDRVIELDLSENGLRGTIPPALGTLTYLETLILAHNLLSGSIPPQLGNLMNLEWLYLTNNQLSGTIPPQLGNLAYLEELYLAGNQLSGCLPAGWQDIEENDLDELGLPFCSDRDVLIALYHATNGANWLRNDNWLTDTPLDQWHGVVTDESGRVIELHLTENRLNGTLPLALDDLAQLEWLDLSENQLNGSIPSDLGNLTNLEGLGLSSNQLSGSIPSELGNLSNLTDLSLFGNNFGGPIPSELSNLSNLEGLDLSLNQLSGSIPSELSNLSNLEGLALLGNKLIGFIPPELGKLANLKRLLLSQNRLTGTIPSELSNLANLEMLYLSENQLSGSIPPELGYLSNLEQLFLNSNQLSGTIPPELGNLTNLTGLSLWGNRLIGTIPRELGKLTNLTGLGLSENQLSGTIPSQLGNLTELEQLFIRDNKLTGCIPESWQKVEENDFDELDLPFCTVSQSPAAPQTLTTAQVFAKVSPAIAFVHTEIATGSGVLVEGNYVLTNAHVVWPYHAARVVFSDGTAFDQVPLKDWDLLADLALLGPIDAPAQPLALLDGENVPIGSDVYLIGYPAEVEIYPQPTIARGILSRLREWEPVGITYLQTDASIAGGQSGGALVSDKGDVIGISGFIVSEGQFALVASAADLLPRIRQLLAGEDPSGLGDRRLTLQGGSLRHEVTLEGYWGAYIVNEPAGSAIEVALRGADDARFRIFDPFGNEFTETETSSFAFVTQSSGPHFLIFSQFSDKTTLTANRRLVRFIDPDQGREIRVGQSLPGNIDFPGDVDYFLLHLEKDEAVEVVTRSALTDTSLGIMRLGAPTEESIGDDNSGGGLFGLDARLLFQAPYTGEYALVVVDAFGIAPGGYVISVARAQSTNVPASQVPMVTIKTHINVRQGPGTNYPVIDTAAPGEQYVVTGKSPGLGDWWQISYKGGTAWIYAPLVTATDAESVQVVATPVP